MAFRRSALRSTAFELLTSRRKLRITSILHTHKSDRAAKRQTHTFAAPITLHQPSFASSDVNPGDSAHRSQFRPTNNMFASFWRGGTSKGVFIELHRLPNFVYPMDLLHKDHQYRIRLEDRSERLETLLRPILGSPDSYGRQLNGLGGGISSLSKAVIYRRAPEKDGDADVEYTFAQLGVEDGVLDLTGNCGNLTAAVGPVVLNEGIYIPPSNRFDFTKAVENYRADRSQRVSRSVPVTIRLRNTNTQKLIHATFMALLPAINPSSRWIYQPLGSYAIDGVPGTASKIRLKFLDPGGSKTGKTLPTGNSVDVLETECGSFRASLVDVTNPGVFVAGADFGWDSERSPEDLNANKKLMNQLEIVRKKGAELMGLDPTVFKATPKIVLVYPPKSANTHIQCQALSMEKAHKAVSGTLALNLGAACKIPGTIPHQISHRNSKSEIAIGHPSGKAEVGAEVEGGKVNSVELSRTARRLMEGFVNWSENNAEKVIEIPVKLDDLAM